MNWRKDVADIEKKARSPVKVKKFDLEDRSFEFARRCRDFVKKLPKTLANMEYGRQLIKSSGSQAANYIEANESLSKKDFLMRIKISRKETKESRLWLRLCETNKAEELVNEQRELIQEAEELMRIYSSIFKNSQ